MAAHAWRISEKWPLEGPKWHFLSKKTYYWVIFPPFMPCLYSHLICYGFTLVSYGVNMLLPTLWHWQWLPFATVQTQIFVHSTITKTIAVNLVKILFLCESCSSPTFSYSRWSHFTQCRNQTSFTNGPSLPLWLYTPWRMHQITT